ncbi:hypothetical protein Slin15195_G128560 [Septoria linicola]|uniref:Uncharacterized protein n=1 Tax=Septoria linicola TaxID=215465 RepID=A0A9Q9ER54_9PEZI|nr:hypothetical protein Slin15195_G128560 [Septoria linicola]
MSRLGNDRVELSDIQALCLLSIVGFNSGRFAQAGLDLAIASHLTKALECAPGATDTMGLRYCAHSIVMLENLQGTAAVVADTKSSVLRDPFQETSTMKSLSRKRKDLTVALGQSYLLKKD